MGFRREFATAVPETTMRFTGHPMHAHAQPHVVHMVMGRGVLTVEGEAIVLEPRTSVWLAAGVPHAVRLEEHSIVLGPLLAAGVEPGRRIERLGVVPAITDLMLARMAAEPRTEEQHAVFTGALEELLLRLGSEAFAAPLPVHPLVARIAEVSVGSPATLAALCARVGMSERQVQRIFAEETGMSFSRWRTRRRLNEAVRCLRGGSSGMSAARTAGFATRAGLLRALSRESGVPIEVLREDPLAAAPVPPAVQGGVRGIERLSPPAAPR
ncbi:helix-turn-helix domain-containing protein [Brevibacterium album]|uniref:helix-turn-helix domain-containing protein n=1 Tax=Brevibacterium album TaxID=417948 RepID=UPI0004034523|nr:AraC family transcriptional regulator [Brevibacterium album]